MASIDKLNDTDVLRNCLAPAKLNLFLHITGRRTNSYHELQSVFQLLSWFDVLHFKRRKDGIIRRVTISEVDEEKDLIIRAARLLQTYSRCCYGVDIEIEKNIPLGAGLGGGSSDAATVLLALNRLWQLNLSRQTLQELGLKLGADVPFFVYGQNAFAEGVGDELTALPLHDYFYLIVQPSVVVSTGVIFADQALTRNTKPIKLTEFLEHQNQLEFGHNDMQAVAIEKFPDIGRALHLLKRHNPNSRMSGSGACVFAAYANAANAQADMLKLQSEMDAEWKITCVAGLAKHPMFHFAN